MNGEGGGWWEVSAAGSATAAAAATRCRTIRSAWAWPEQWRRIAESIRIFRGRKTGRAGAGKTEVAATRATHLQPAPLVRLSFERELPGVFGLFQPLLDRVQRPKHLLMRETCHAHRRGAHILNAEDEQMLHGIFIRGAPPPPTFCPEAHRQSLRSPAPVAPRCGSVRRHGTPILLPQGSQKCWRANGAHSQLDSRAVFCSLERRRRTCHPWWQL